MSRHQRVVIPGLPHHITQRGNRRCNVFFDEQDRLVFMRMLGELSQRYFLRHFSFCLMTNHIHLISVPDFEWSLGITMRDLLSPYAVYFNKKYALKGHLWQGRYYSCLMDSLHFWAAMRYVELNPVRAGIVGNAALYQWSSAAAHCGLREDPVLEPMPESPAVIHNWSAWLAEKENDSFLKEFRRSTSTGRPFGSEEFVKGLEERLGRKLLARRGGSSAERGSGSGGFAVAALSPTRKSNAPPEPIGACGRSTFGAPRGQLRPPNNRPKTRERGERPPFQYRCTIMSRECFSRRGESPALTAYLTHSAETQDR